MILRSIARSIIRLGGWQIVGGEISVPKAVVIAAPHTSNWDGFWLLVYKVAVGLDVHFLAKHTLFWWPLGSLLRWLGAIPLNRGSATDVVQRIKRDFERNETFYLALAPEGTRSWKPYWKSGFYRIALSTQVPVILGFIDYKTKRMGLEDMITLSGDVEKDLEVLRAFYEPKLGRRPELAGPIKFPPSA